MALWEDKPIRAYYVAFGRAGREREGKLFEEIYNLRILIDQMATDTQHATYTNAKEWLRNKTLFQYMREAAKPQPPEMIDTDILNGFWQSMGGEA